MSLACRGSLLRGSIGKVLCLVTFFLVVLYFRATTDAERRRKAAENRRSLDAAREMVETFGRDYADNGVTPEARAEFTEKWRVFTTKQLAAGKTTYLMDIVKMRDAETLLGEKLAKAMDLSSATSQEELRARKELVNEAKRMNAAALVLNESGAKRFQSEMEQAGLSASNVSLLMGAYATNERMLLPLRRKSSVSVQRITSAFIGVLDLLQSEWGKWKIEAGVPKFDDEAVVAKGQKLNEELRQASAEYLKTEKEISQLLQPRPVP